MTVPFKQNELYIALENHNLDWKNDQVEEFIRLWNEEYKIPQISKFFKRPELECFLLMLDLIDKKKIHQRIGIAQF